MTAYSIKQLKDSKNGNPFFPKTHTKCVVDDQGNSVESVLQAQTDIINAKQFEQGDVEWDIYPTAGNYGKVTSSGGIYDGIKQSTFVDLADAHITRRSKYIGTDNTWKSGGYHTMFYINGWDYIKITANSSSNSNTYFLTDAGTTGTASMATGSTRNNIAAGQSNTFPIPDDANYLYIVLGSTTDYEQKPLSIELMKSAIPEIDEKIDKYVETVYTVDNMTVQGLLNSSGGITNNSNTQNYRTSDYVSVDTNTTLEFYDLFPNQTNPTYQGLVLYNSANEVVATPQYSEIINHGIIDFANYPSVTKVRFSSSSTITSGIGTKCAFKKKLDIALVQSASDEIDGIVNGSYIDRNYGCTTEGSSDNPQSILYMTSNTPCLKGGYVSNISGYFKAAGTLSLAVGFLDQNGYVIVESEHSVTVPSQGYNSIDVENLGIYMSKDDYLFAKVDGNCFPKYGVDSSAVTGLSVRGFEYPASIRTDGVYFCLAWTVKTSTEGYEDLNEKVTDNEKKIETLQDSVSELANGNIITDKVTGIPYEITIRNGQIVLVPNQYNNVLVIGNSITKHGEAAIWPASDRGMAATKPEYDFCGIMQTQMRLKDNTTTVTRLNAAVWEGNLSYSLSTLLDGYMTSTTDLVVIRLGENVSNTSGFEAALNSMIAYIYTVNANARILITSMFWANEAKDAALKNAATTNGLTYVKISQYGNSAYQEATGHYTYNTDFTAISEITNSAVARHPSNKGMCAIANEILGALGYERSSNTYSLQSVTVGGVTGNMYVLNQ